MRPFESVLVRDGRSQQSPEQLVVGEEVFEQLGSGADFVRQFVHVPDLVHLDGVAGRVNKTPSQSFPGSCYVLVHFGLRRKLALAGQKLRHPAGLPKMSKLVA